MINRGSTPGDIPPALYRAATEILKDPIASIYNRVARTGRWPARWKVEHAFALKKIPVPLTKNDIRAISRSPFLCSQYEKFVVEWLLEVVGPQIDWGQYGGQPGSSIVHLIVELLTFVHYNLDLSWNMQEM